MCAADVLSGYLDVKISARSRRGFTPWKAWQKQWCEIKRLDNMENGVELKFKSSADGSVISNVILPRSSTICRTESRTKQYAFGVFTLGRNQKPLLFLSGSCETDSQLWMSTIRKMLCVATYLPVGESNFHVSIIDNNHSRSAGLVGLHGVLGTNSQEIIISDPCTGEPKICWKWYHFHQYHLQASYHPKDEKSICVMHTSNDFVSGPGQLYIYCKESPRLLNYLISRGKCPKSSPGFISSRRLSRSEGDLCDQSMKDMCIPDSPVCFRSNSGSDDSGVRVSMTSDDFVLKTRMGSSLSTLGLALLTKTPGGSETNGESLQDLSITSEVTTLTRRESGISLASGVYEEIPDMPPVLKTNPEFAHHVYENPFEVIDRLDKHQKIPPPPLPPRLFDRSSTLERDRNIDKSFSSQSSTPYKQRCNTLPAKDLARISQIFTNESDYMVMSPTKTNKLAELNECQYVPMSPIANFKTKIESCYMVMSGKKSSG